LFKFVPNKFSLQQKKSNQKNAATLATSLKSRGFHLDGSVIMLRQTDLALPALAALVRPCTSTRKGRSDMLAQKAHDNATA